EAADAAKRARAAFDDAKKKAGQDARWIERFVSPFVRQVEAELAMSEKSSEQTLLAFADEIVANPRFDAWGVGLFRLERIAEQAKRSGRDALARDIYERMRRIDPGYPPGSTAVPVKVAATERRTF
ncbi:MAG TPA: hypothetical protein VGB47_10425, partial [Thermoanaerobaculia bacterium]